MRVAAGAKPFWMTLQIAWSGVTPTADRPDVVPRFPSLHEERFMACQAIANGARGLVFFGGHLTQVATPADAALGWNWTFYGRVLKPLLTELRSEAIAPMLARPRRRRDGGCVGGGRRDGDAAGRHDALGHRAPPRRSDEPRDVQRAARRAPTEQPLRAGEVLGEWVQDAAATADRRRASRRSGASTLRTAAFTDWVGGHDARVYRFGL